MFSNTQIVVSHPCFGRTPTGLTRVHLELPPKQVANLIGYDPRILVRRPGKSGRTRTRDLLPHNVAGQIVQMQNTVQRSIDQNRVDAMVSYLHAAVHGEFGDWGPIEVVTSSEPKPSEDGMVAYLDPDADYFIADAQHRYCALLDFIQQYPDEADTFTQGLTICVIPADKLVAWAGQKFHDHNYFSVAVRPGKALSVDSRDPVNALAKSLEQHPDIAGAGGVAYERDTLLAGDTRFATHSVLHRFVRAFAFGRAGVDKSTDRAEVDDNVKISLWDYITSLAMLLPWSGEQRDLYLTRTSVVLTSLAVVGHDLYKADVPSDVRNARLQALASIDWKRTNLSLVGVVGSEKNGQVQPASSRQAIDSTIRYLRELLGLLPPPQPKPIHPA